MRVTVIGANGFVGSAFVRLLEAQPGVDLVQVTRQNFESLPVTPSDVVIEAACNSRKYLADQDPLGEFELSVTHRLKSLQRFPGALQLHISSVDVYSELDTPATTREDTAIDLARVSRYGLHKLLAEQLVRHYAPHWLILRLAGMVGPGLRKNPVYDILHGLPVRIHPDSRYQFLHTDAVAQLAWSLVQSRVVNETFNLCGEGLVSMREAARLADRSIDCSALPPDAVPRIVEANTQKLRSRFPIPETLTTLKGFLEHAQRVRCRP